MPMTVVVTRDVPPRFRGFLASCMLEVAAGVYTSPRLSASVRERVWSVLADWHGRLGRGSVVMTWRDAKLPSGQGLLVLGDPPSDIIDHEGVFLGRRALRAGERRRLA
jgi:CRISPR-associated protein Cas2